MSGKQKDDIKKSGKQRVAAYIRVSTDLTDQENSYETQEEYFKQLLVNNKEWIYAGVYSDYGISGTSKQKRIGFRRILRHCKEGRIDGIVTKSISRFARNTADFIMALDTLEEAGVAVFFEKEGLNTASSANEFILIALAAIAQEESRSISTNINWSNQKRFLKGDVRNQDIYGYRFTNEYIITETGYSYKAVEVVEEEAEIVRLIFQNYTNGMTLTEIARRLNFQNIPHKVSPYEKKRMKNSAKGQLNAGIDEGWTSEKVRLILKNERYTGDVLIQKTYTEDYLTHKVRVNKGEVPQYWVYDHHPAIISMELFERAKRIRESSVNCCQKGRTSHAFSGRILCGNCGRYYHIRNAKRHPIWFCPSTAKNNGKSICQNEKVYEEQIIRMFRKAVLERFHLTTVSICDNEKSLEILSGHLKRDEREPMLFSGECERFVDQILIRFEKMQQMDFMEWDRTLMKHEIAAAKISAENAYKREKAFLNQKETLETRKLIMNDVNITNEEIMGLEKSAREEREKQTAAQMEGKRLREQLEHMEDYWEDIEMDYEYRSQAIEWMKSLPEGSDGVIEFLNGITDTYVKAFVLSITIHDSLNYTVHWFDDIRTEVQMYSEIEGYCRK